MFLEHVFSTARVPSCHVAIICVFDKSSFGRMMMQERQKTIIVDTESWKEEMGHEFRNFMFKRHPDFH